MLLGSKGIVYNTMGRKKGMDQLHSYHAVDLSIFHKCKTEISHCNSDDIVYNKSFGKITHFDDGTLQVLSFE